VSEKPEKAMTNVPDDNNTTLTHRRNYRSNICFVLLAKFGFCVSSMSESFAATNFIIIKINNNNGAIQILLANYAIKNYILFNYDDWFPQHDTTRIIIQYLNNYFLLFNRFP
jgi:hypothetical protein